MQPARTLSLAASASASFNRASRAASWLCSAATCCRTSLHTMVAMSLVLMLLAVRAARASKLHSCCCRGGHLLERRLPGKHAFPHKHLV